MQTTVTTTTIREHDKTYRAAKTAEHPEQIMHNLDCDPEGRGGLDNPHTIAVQNGGHVLDITSIPASMLEITANGATINATGLVLVNHDIKELSIGAGGQVKESYAIESMEVIANDGYTGEVKDPIPGGFEPLPNFSNNGTGEVIEYPIPGGYELIPNFTKIGVDNGILGGPAVITGSPRTGYFNINGDHLYFLYGHYSEQKVIIDYCGTYDALGDRYVYNSEDPNMEPTQLIDGIQYGIYLKQDATHVVDALNRCINAMFPEPVVIVSYVNERFIITSISSNVDYMHILNDPFSISEVLGFDDDMTLTGGSAEYSAYPVYIPGWGVGEVVSVEPGYITVAAEITDPLNKICIVDTAAVIKVQVLDA